MRSDSSITVNYSNLTYAFIKFQEQYKNLCQNISEADKNKINASLKRANTFVWEYLPFIRSSEFRSYLLGELDKIKAELYSDTEFNKLCVTANKNINQGIDFNQRYYYYLVKILKTIRLFGDELSKTFMPNKTDSEKLFKYWNNNSFFEQFTTYKSNTAEKLASFTIKDFKDGFAYFMGFYFAYYLFIDEKSRVLCERVFSNILNIVLDRNILIITVSPYSNLSSEKKELLKQIDYEIHNGINNIFFRCNYSYSLYGVMPRMEDKVLIDRTAI